jgi:hypothetical protein
MATQNDTRYCKMTEAERPPLDTIQGLRNEEWHESSEWLGEHFGLMTGMLADTEAVLHMVAELSGLMSYDQQTSTNAFKASTRRILLTGMEATARMAAYRLEEIQGMADERTRKAQQAEQAAAAARPK